MSTALLSVIEVPKRKSNDDYKLGPPRSFRLPDNWDKKWQTWTRIAGMGDSSLAAAIIARYGEKAVLEISREDLVQRRALHEQNFGPLDQLESVAEIPRESQSQHPASPRGPSKKK